MLKKLNPGNWVNLVGKANDLDLPTIYAKEKFT